MNTKKFHHKTISSFLAIIIFIVTFGLVIPSVQSESLVMTIDFAPSSIVIQGSSLQILIHSNNTVNLNISAKTTTKTCLLFSNITSEKNIQKEIIVPIVYPLDSNFTLVFDAENMQSTLIHQQTKDFFLEPSKSGNYSCKGRILNQGFVNKTGLEGAFIEVMSGPTYTYTYSEDDGYFSLDHLLPGPYKLRISHACTKVVKEYIVEVNEKSVFENIEMHPHKIPDFDFWMNKSSGSHYERGETATIYMRSRLNMEVNLFQITEEGEKPILLKCPLQANKIRRFYWVIPDDVNLGPLQFSMTPVGNEYCGSARYSIDIINSIQYGALEGYVLVNNKPIQGADVFFPYEYIPHTTTDQYGKFVFKDVKGGNYHLRCTMPGFEEKNLPHVDVIRGQINGPITL